MIVESAQVAAIDSDALWVETIQRSVCGRCSAKSGCGQSLLSRFGEKPIYLRVLLQQRPASHYQVGDNISIGINDNAVVKSALLSYLLPLSFMLVFMAIAHIYFAAEMPTITMAIVGIFLGGLFVRWHQKKYLNDERHQPIIVDENTLVDITLSEISRNSTINLAIK
ncbi:MAG: SoxR reducing system RseC family protein [Pseudomonadota bacterium]